MLQRLQAALLMLGLSLLVGSAWAGLPSLQLDAHSLQQPVPIERSLLLEDPSASLNASQALAQLMEHGRLISGSPHLGYSGSTWWLGISLQVSSPESLFLVLDNPYLDDIQLWLLSPDQAPTMVRAGDLLPFSQRSAPYPNFILALPPLSNGEHALLLRIASNSSLNLPLQIVSLTTSKQLIAQKWLHAGLLCGALLIMALFHLVKFSALREPQLGYYCATLLSASLYYAVILGPINMLWPQWPALSTMLLNLTGVLCLVFSTLFIKHVLALHGRRLGLLCAAFFTLMLLSATPAILGINDYRQQQWMNWVFFGNGLLQLAMTFYGVKLGRPFAKSLSVFWSTTLLLMILLPLSRAGVLSDLPWLAQISLYLPAISFFMFGVFSGMQLEMIRADLFASQQQAIGNLERYQALFNNAAEGIVRCNHAGVIVEANPSFLRLLGLPPEQASQLLGQPIHRLVKTSDWAHLFRQLSPEQPSVSGECQLRDHQGAVHWIYLSLHLQPAQDYIEGIVVDLSERRALEQNLQHLACHDSLTGLLNRREMERLLQESLKHPDSQTFSHLLHLDLDQFKQINDLCGHAAGDQLLRQLASALQVHVQEPAKLARIGGDEFAVLLAHLDDASAMAQAEALRACVEQFVFSWQGRAFRLFVSIGLLELTSAVSDWETALNWADNASHQAKHQGRNRVHRFNPSDGLLLEHQRQLQWITRLRAAIEHQHFELFYQPVLALQHAEDGFHYEILLRYRDPQTGGWVAPGEFLAAAERYGLLGAIDRWVIRRFFDWIGQNPQHLRQLAQVNLNLSGSSLQDNEIHALLSEQLARQQLPGAKLCIEVTEMVALGELGASAEWICNLREQGIKVALDDFGSGFASYAYLRHLPLDVLKIDGTFIRGLEHDPINQAMVSSMQQIAEQLGLKTVAEFVESQATLDCLRSLGIDYAQGYFIDRPQPLENLADHHQAQLNLALPSASTKTDVAQ